MAFHVDNSSTGLLVNAFADTQFRVYDIVDPSKYFNINVGGTTGTYSTLRTNQTVSTIYDLPDTAGVTSTIALLQQAQTFTALNTFSGGVIIGDPGTESAGIDISGVTYQSTFKVSDINGTNYAQTILHRHSTTLEPLILGARSNSNTSAHASVTAGMNLFSIYSAGYVTDNYKLFAGINFTASSLGTLSATSSPGKLILTTTPDGTVVPTATLTLDSDKSALFAGVIGTQITASRVVVTDASKNLIASAVTATEMGYLSGVTSSVQTQLGLKATDSLVVHLAGVETITGQKTIQDSIFTTNALNLSVGQLKFPSAANPSADVNTLDDYEESTWTPTIGGSGTPGTPTYTNQIGSYTKIGDRVFFDCYVTWTNITGSPTGGLVLGGLPFTSAATGYRAMSVNPEGLTLNGAAYYFTAYLNPSSTQITLINSDGNGNTAVSPVDTSGGLMIAGHYKI